MQREKTQEHKKWTIPSRIIYVAIFKPPSPQSLSLHTIGPFLELLVPRDSECFNASPRLLCFSIVVKGVGSGCCRWCTRACSHAILWSEFGKDRSPQDSSCMQTRAVSRLNGPRSVPLVCWVLAPGKLLPSPEEAKLVLYKTSAV